MLAISPLSGKRMLTHQGGTHTNQATVLRDFGGG